MTFIEIRKVTTETPLNISPVSPYHIFEQFPMSELRTTVGNSFKKTWNKQMSKAPEIIPLMCWQNKTSCFKAVGYAKHAHTIISTPFTSWIKLML